MKFFLKLLFIFFIAVSMQPAVYCASSSDTLLVSQHETAGMQVDNTVRTRQQRIRVFFTYIRQHRETAETGSPAIPDIDCRTDMTCLAGDMLRTHEHTQETLHITCTLLI